jgi:D-glycero-D-manno-heptose 1,7-bisphosphate phosphatase
MRRAVFMDRDGVLNPEVFYESSGEWEAPMRPADLSLNPRVPEALHILVALGFDLILVSNQGAFAKGKAELASLLDVHDRLVNLLAAAGITFRDSFYSFSHPAGIMPGFSGPSLERKPSPYFLMLAQAKYGLDLDGSWMIGDRETDVQCGIAAGVSTIGIVGGRNCVNTKTVKADFFAVDLYEAALLISRSWQGVAN